MKTGVIGTGSMGRNHVRVLSEISELVGITDAVKETMVPLADTYGTQAFDTVDELISQDLEAVVVATPTQTHFDTAKKCLEKGLHVLMEKPICKTPEEGDKIVALAKELGLTLAVGQIERHNPVVGAAKENLNKGAFGDLFTLSSRRVSSFPARIKDVGVILDIGIHDIDAMRYISGQEVSSVYATAGLLGKENLEKYGNILLEFENGVSGFVETNFLTPHRVRKLWLTCSKDFVELDYMNQAMRVSSSQLGEFDANNLFQVPYEYHIRDIALKKQEPLKLEIQDFIDAVQEKRDPLVTGEDGLTSLKVALAAIESYKRGEKVSLQ